jgi:hypothetical protein
MFFVSVMRFVLACSLTLQQSIKVLNPWDLTDGARSATGFDVVRSALTAMISNSNERRHE